MPGPDVLSNGVVQPDAIAAVRSCQKRSRAAITLQSPFNTIDFEWNGIGCFGDESLLTRTSPCVSQSRKRRFDVGSNFFERFFIKRFTPLVLSGGVGIADDALDQFIGLL